MGCPRRKKGGRVIWHADRVERAGWECDEMTWDKRVRTYVESDQFTSGRGSGTSAHSIG